MYSGERGKNSRLRVSSNKLKALQMLFHSLSASRVAASSSIYSGGGPLKCKSSCGVWIKPSGMRIGPGGGIIPYIGGGGCIDDRGCIDGGGCIDDGGCIWGGIYIDSGGCKCGVAYIEGGGCTCGGRYVDGVG